MKLKFNLLIASESLLDDTAVSNSDYEEEPIEVVKEVPIETSSSTSKIPHSLSFSEIIVTEFSQNQYSKIYPPSFRYVILIENLLFLFVPAKEDTSVLILKDKYKTSKSHQYFSSAYFHQQNVSKDLSDCESLSNATHTSNNSATDNPKGGGGDIEGHKSDELDFEIKRIDSKMSFLSLKGTLKKKSDIKLIKRKKLPSRRKNNYQTFTSTSSTNTLSSTSFSDGKEDSFFALSGIIGRETITSIQVLSIKIFNLITYILFIVIY